MKEFFFIWMARYIPTEGIWAHGEGGCPMASSMGGQNDQNEGCYNLPQWTAKNNEKKLSLTDQIPSIATKISTGIRTNYDLAPSGLSGVSKRKKCEKKNFSQIFKDESFCDVLFWLSIMAYETHSFAYGMKKNDLTTYLLCTGVLEGAIG